MMRSQWRPPLFEAVAAYGLERYDYQRPVVRQLDAGFHKFDRLALKQPHD